MKEDTKQRLTELVQHSQFTESELVKVFDEVKRHVLLRQTFNFIVFAILLANNFDFACVMLAIISLYTVYKDCEWNTIIDHEKAFVKTLFKNSDILIK